MKKNFLIISMLIMGLSVVGFAKQPPKKPVSQKVCVQKSRKTGKCLKYETRKVSYNKPNNNSKPGNNNKPSNNKPNMNTPTKVKPR